MAAGRVVETPTGVRAGALRTLTRQGMEMVMNNVGEFTRGKHDAIDNVRLARARLDYATRIFEAGRDAFADAVREAYALGVPMAVIGRQVGLSRQRIHQIAKDGA